MRRQLSSSAYKAALVKNVLNAIREAGKVEGSDQFMVDNGAVISALVEVMGCFSAMHDFDKHTPEQLAEKVRADLLRSIERYQHRPAITRNWTIFRETDVN